MSPSKFWRASFQTMLTVPALSLTAIRGKSFALPRLFPGMNEATIETTLTDAVADGRVQELVGSVRQEKGTRATSFFVGSELQGGSWLLIQLNSHATYTSPRLTSTVG